MQLPYIFGISSVYRRYIVGISLVGISLFVQFSVSWKAITPKLGKQLIQNPTKAIPLERPVSNVCISRCKYNKFSAEKQEKSQIIGLNDPKIGFA